MSRSRSRERSRERIYSPKRFDDKNKKFHVGNLPLTITDEEIRNQFKGFLLLLNFIKRN